MGNSNEIIEITSGGIVHTSDTGAIGSTPEVRTYGPDGKTLKSVKYADGYQVNYNDNGEVASVIDRNGENINVNEIGKDHSAYNTVLKAKNEGCTSSTKSANGGTCLAQSVMDFLVPSARAAELPSTTDNGGNADPSGEHKALNDGVAPKTDEEIANYLKCDLSENNCQTAVDNYRNYNGLDDAPLANPNSAPNPKDPQPKVPTATGKTLPQTLTALDRFITQSTEGTTFTTTINGKQETVKKTRDGFVIVNNDGFETKITIDELKGGETSQNDYSSKFIKCF